MFRNEITFQQVKGILQTNQDKGLRFLAKYIAKTAEIKSLNLSSCQLTDRSIDRIWKILQNNNSILNIDLSNNKISVAGMKRLLGLIQESKRLIIIEWENITDPDLKGGLYIHYLQIKLLTNPGGVYLSEDVRKHLLMKPLSIEHLDQLTTTIRENPQIITEIDVAYPPLQAYLVRNRYLQYKHFYIEISCVTITKEFIQILFSSPGLPANVRSIEIIDCNVNRDVFVELVNMLPNFTSLARLICLRCKINDDMAIYLWSHLISQRHPSLAFIDLSENLLSDRSMTQLANLLRESVTLVGLTLNAQQGTRNSITDIGLITLGQALQQNRTLRSLSLLNAKITSEGIDGFLGLLSNNFALGEFIYCNMPTRPSGYLLSAEFAYYRQLEQQYNTLKRKINKIISRNNKKVMDLIQAVNKEDINLIDKIFDRGVSLYAAEQTTGNTMLHLAAENAYKNVILYLLSKRFNRHFTNKQGETALDIAKQLKKSDIVALLESEQLPATPVMAELPKPVSARGKRKMPPKPTNPREQITSYFKRPRNNEQTNAEASGQATSVFVPISASNYQTPKLAYFMTLNGNTEFFTNPEVKLDPNTRYENGQTLLHPAALHGHHTVISILLDNFVMSPNAIDQLKRSPLHYACMLADRFKTAQAIQILLAHEIVADMPDIYGITPLYFLAGGFDQTLNADINNPNLRECARLLIKAGANVQHAVHDLQLNIANFTVLHKAISRHNYYLVTAILATQAFNLKLQDSNGDTIYHWAVKVANLNILTRLLIEPGAIDICKTITNTNNQTVFTLARELAAAISQYIPIWEILNAYDRKKMPSAHSGISWVKNFNLFYGARQLDKTCVIKLDDVHNTLAESLRRQCVQRSPGNKLAAALSFIVSDKAYTEPDHRRICITIRLDSIDNVHVRRTWQKIEFIGTRPRCPEAKDRIIRRLTAIPKDKQDKLTDYFSTREQPLSVLAIQELYSKPATEKESFELFFHHSEQALLDFLEDDIAQQEITNKLIQDSQFNRGCKVYAIILNLHSQQYICDNCEVGILGEQNNNQSVFLKKLVENLCRESCVLGFNKQLRMITCASSLYPTHAKSRQSNDAHLELEVDLRRHYGNIILQRDLTTTTSQSTIFSSRKGDL